MVLTSSTQWTIPLSTSSIAAASSPSLIKHGSVVGLRTCQLSAPALAIATDDLHSTSSRRLLGAPDTSNRRSAGSFRQLVGEDLCLKSHEYVCTDIPDWLCGGKEYDAPYDGIAIPWSPGSLFPHTTPGISDAVNVNLAGLHGEITAEDVDLLPMPGLLNCPSPFYNVPHACSPKSSVRSTEISTLESSGNSCLSNVMVPNYLGLPPNFCVEVDRAESANGAFANACRVNAPVTHPADAEHDARGASNHFPSAAGVCENFADSLAGLWRDPAIDCNPNHLQYESESLASIFNVFPQKFHGFSSSGRMDQSHVNTCDYDMAHSVTGELRYLVDPIGEACDEKVKVSGSVHALSANEGPKLHENNGSMMWEATKQGISGKTCNAMPHSDASELKNSPAMDTSVMLSESSLGGSMDSASSLEKKCMKRPFSMLQQAGVALSMASTACMPGSHVWYPQPNSMGLPMPMKEEAATHSFSTTLYKSQKDAKLAGFYYHMAKEQARMDEDMMPKPPPAKMRRRHGTAMDPQSVAARNRREKFSDRIRILQSLVPNGERLDTVSMLGQTLEYVRFLQHQVWQLYHGKDPASLETCEKWKDFVEAGRVSTNLA